MSQTPSSFTPTPYTPSGDASFTPTQGNYKELKPFRYWCQKVLPLVYDDSLSYYELLCKVVDYLNKTMEDVDTLHGDVDNLHTAYTELQTDMNNKYHGMTQWMNSSYTDLVNFVNTYFANLDVQTEINNKLDVMATDGTLSALIEPYVQPKVNNKINSMVSSGEFADIVEPFVEPAVDDEIGDMVTDGRFKAITDPKVVQATDAWLGQHITNPSNPPLDTSLSLANAAAPAKTVGDKAYLYRGLIESTDKTKLSEFLEIGDIGFSGTVMSSFTDVPSDYQGWYCNLENIQGFSGLLHIQKLTRTNNFNSGIIRLINTATNPITVGNWIEVPNIDNLYNWNGLYQTSGITKLSDYRKLGTAGFIDAASSALTDLPSDVPTGTAITVENIKAFTGTFIIQRLYTTTIMPKYYQRLINYTSSPASISAWTLTDDDTNNYTWRGMRDSAGVTKLEDYLTLGTTGFIGSASSALLDLPTSISAGTAITVENIKGFTGSYIIQRIYTTTLTPKYFERIVNTTNVPTTTTPWLLMGDDSDKYCWRGLKSSLASTKLSDYREIGTAGMFGEVTSTLTDLPSGYSNMAITVQNIKGFSGNFIIQKICKTSDFYYPYMRLIDYTNTPANVSAWVQMPNP